MSFIWGLSSLFLIIIIKPIVDKLIKKIPNILIYMCISLFILDLIFIIYHNLGKKYGSDKNSNSDK